MFTHALLILALTSAGLSDEARKYKDPFVVLDQHLSQSLVNQYLFPWSQLLKAAAALDSLEDPIISSNSNKFQITMNVRRFKPNELKVKVKNSYIIVEGDHKESNPETNVFSNRFVQRFVMPAGSRPEEVTAVLQEDGVLNITVPNHKLPPPPPEREVPIEVRLPKTTAPEPTTTAAPEPTITPTPMPTPTPTPMPTTKKPEPSSEKPTSVTPEDFDLAEATTYAGKIRKKDLKTTTKAIRDNEVTKGDNNGLDYSLVEGEK